MITSPFHFCQLKGGLSYWKPEEPPPQWRAGMFDSVRSVNSLAVQHAALPGINTRSVASLKAAKGTAEWKLGRDENIGASTSPGKMNTAYNASQPHKRFKDACG